MQYYNSNKLNGTLPETLDHMAKSETNLQLLTFSESRAHQMLSLDGKPVDLDFEVARNNPSYFSKKESRKDVNHHYIKNLEVINSLRTKRTSRSEMKLVPLGEITRFNTL